MTIDDFKARVGQEIGISQWHVIDQAKINAFADVTGDHQYIHVDPVRAAQTPFGGTIAHGLLTLSLSAVMFHEAIPPIANRKIGINYGFNKVRFLAPVKCGSRVRGHFVLRDLTDRGNNEYVTTFEITIEIENSQKPAMIAEWLGMWLMA
ncbi:MAG: MaoC family dehydratase [Xanthobacteraceae bacterium]|nr:MAG: MaoC family dehydratase [Xanthobacteraceae bacterium]